MKITDIGRLEGGYAIKIPREPKPIIMPLLSSSTGEPSNEAERVLIEAQDRMPVPIDDFIAGQLRDPCTAPTIGAWVYRRWIVQLSGEAKTIALTAVGRAEIELRVKRHVLQREIEVERIARETALLELEHGS